MFFSVELLFQKRIMNSGFEMIDFEKIGVPIFPIELWINFILTRLNLYDWNNLARTCKSFAFLFKKELVKREKFINDVKILKTYGTSSYKLQFKYKNITLRINNLEFCEVDDNIYECLTKKTLFHYTKRSTVNVSIIINNKNEVEKKLKRKGRPGSYYLESSDSDASKTSSGDDGDQDIEIICELEDGYISELNIDYTKKLNLLIVETFFLLIHSWHPTSRLLVIGNKQEMINKKRKLDIILMHT